MTHDVIEAERGLPTPRRHWASLAIAMGLMLTTLDAAMVVVMVPLIAETYAVEPSLAIWVVTAYQLTMACLVLQAAALSERFAHWKMFCLGLALFAGASLICAFSTSFAMLMAGRVLQGIGAAAVHSITMVLTRLSHPRSRFGRAAGVNASMVGLAMASGPSVAAAILLVTDWRGVFFVTAPLALAAVIIGVSALPRVSKIPGRHDILSAIALALAMIVLLMTLNELRAGTSAVLVVAGIAACAGLFTYLVRRQSRSPRPMFPVDLLAIRPIAFALAAAVCMFAVQGLALVSLPFHLRDLTDLSAAMVGLLITPWPAGVAITATFAGRWSDRYSPRILCSLAACVMLAGLTGLVLLPQDAGIWDVAWRMLLCGIGFGMFNTPNNRSLILRAPIERTTAGGAMLATGRLTGQALGAASASIAFSYWPVGGGAVALGMAMAVTCVVILLSALRPVT